MPFAAETFLVGENRRTEQAQRSWLDQLPDEDHARNVASHPVQLCAGPADEPLVLAEANERQPASLPQPTKT
jgi:hypothetical protein